MARNLALEVDPAKAKMAMARYAKKIQTARRDPNAFIEFAGKIEGGGFAQQAEIHREWQALCSENDNVVLWAPVYHGKSNQLSRWRCEWEIGNDPNLRVAIISETEKQPKKILGAIAEDILSNERLKQCFPDLKPSTGKRKIWRDDAIMVDREDVMLDPTIQVLGAHGAILGSRLDLLILDDLLNQLNTLTEYQRDKMFEWLTQTVFSRLTHNARIWVIGTAWHEDDAMHRLAANEMFASKRYAATYFDESGVEIVSCPELWTLERLHSRAKTMGTIAARRMLWNELSLPEGGRISREWIEQCLLRGRHLTLVRHWGKSPAYTGVDLGATTKKRSDKTVIFTAAKLPDGSRRVLDVRSGKWSGPEIIRQLEDVHTRYDSKVFVENNGGQNFLLQFASTLSAVPVQGHHTGMNKHDVEWGVESIGVELEKALWVLPCDAELVPPAEVMACIEGAVNYSPGGHTDDHLMAWWICREGMRRDAAAGLGSFSLDSLRR